MRNGFGVVAVALLASGCVITIVEDKGVVSGDTGTIDTETPTTETGGSTPADSGGSGDSGLGDPDADGDGYPASVDCNDADPAVHPDADEICDGVDNNCDSALDDQAAATIATTNFGTLDEALAAAVAGDRVDVCPGVHAITPVTWDGGELRLRGVAGREVTTVTCAGTAFRVTDDGLVGLRGLTLAGVPERTSVDRLIVVQDDATFDLVESAVVDNGGGGIHLDQTSGAVLTATDSEISGHGLGSDPKTSAPAQPQAGGAIYGVGAFQITLTNTVVEDNYAQAGGGVHLTNFFDPNTALTLDGSSITGNTGDFFGGGAQVSNVPIVGTNGAEISGNTARYGGGVVTLKSSISGVLVSTNAALNDGGGLFVEYDSLFAPLADPAFAAVVVDGNTADRGAGVWAESDCSFDAYSAITANVATSGGGGLGIPADDVTVIADATELGSAAAGNDNAPDDVWANGAAILYDGPATFSCNGLTGCQ